MSVPEQVPYKEYRATGSNNSFEITFYLPDPKDLVVMVNKEIPLVGAYSIVGDSVVFSTPPNEGDLVELTRDTQLDRETEYKSYDNSFRPETINFDLDKIWLVLQESNLVDAKILARLKQEIEWRRTHDFNYDELAQVREKQLFDALKGYTDTLLASTNPGVFQGVIAGVVFARDGKSIQTHLEELLNDLAVHREDIDLKANQQYVDEQLGLKAPQETTYTKIETDAKFSAYAGGRKGYTTLALAQADQSNLTANTVVDVTNDPNASNNGAYQWNGITLTKSAYDPLTQAKNYADANGLFKPIQFTSTVWTHADQLKTNGWYRVPSVTVATNMGLPNPAAGFLLVVSNYEFGGNSVKQEWFPQLSSKMFLRASDVSGVFPVWGEVVTSSNLAESIPKYAKDEITELSLKPYDIVNQSTKNLFNPESVLDGKYLNNSGVVISTAGWGMSGYIPVTAGSQYTLSGNRGRHGLSFFANNTDTTPISYVSTETLPLTVTAPVGANFAVFNLYNTTVPTFSKIQFELGSSATSYEPYKEFLIDAAFIQGGTLFSNSTLSINGNDMAVTGVVDGVPISLNLWKTRSSGTDDATVFNFSGDYVNDILQRNLNDDVAPMRLDGTTIGANHGYQKSNLTLAGHGKTVADIGSVWSSGGKQYVIVDIVSTSVLSVTSRADNSAYAISELTHVSGASNTASFTPTATSSTQWYPAIRDRKLTCFVENVKIDLTQDATYSFKNTVKFLESYSIMKKSDIVEWLITNKGQNHMNYNAVPAYTVNFGYTFDHECGCTIYFGGVGRKTVDLVDQMITQSIQLAQGNGVVYNYIPKAVEFTAGGFTYNFSQLENLYSKNPSTPLYLTTARQETETSPIDRIVMLNDQVGYATGYLPVLDAAPSIRPTNASNKYLEIRNGSLKLYPRLIDSASITKINDGDSFAAIAYRKYFKRSTERTCKYVVRSEMGDYLYLDWHSAKTDDIELPADLVGREFGIVEKSSNVTLLSKFASNSILVKINSTKPYGYLVLKFK